MIKHNNIFIKNIYYMLSYAYQNLRNICETAVDSEAFDNIHDLFAVILYKGISNQLKRGLYREYEEQKDSLNCLRGKINISESIKTASLINKKLVCEYDEFSENSYFNKVLKSTCELLIRKGSVKQENKKLLKKILIYFADVDAIDLKKIEWNKIAYHRNNITYKMLINICYLIVKGLLLTTDSGDLKLNKYLDDQCMHRLYEKFVLEYFKKHNPEFNASSSYINWDVESSNGLEFLPNMKTDIMLQFGDKTLIIDTKLYSHSMQQQYDKMSLISANLYQIFTYVKNKDTNNTGNVSGMLLYAKTEDEITPNNEYVMSGNKIIVRTLDLNEPWDYISKSLAVIADDFKIFASYSV